MLPNTEGRASDHVAPTLLLADPERLQVAQRRPRQAKGPLVHVRQEQSALLADDVRLAQCCRPGERDDWCAPLPPPRDPSLATDDALAHPSSRHRPRGAQGRLPDAVVPARLVRTCSGRLLQAAGRLLQAAGRLTPLTPLALASPLAAPSRSRSRSRRSTLPSPRSRRPSRSSRSRRRARRRSACLTACCSFTRASGSCSAPSGAGRPRSTSAARRCVPPPTSSPPPLVADASSCLAH